MPRFPNLSHKLIAATVVDVADEEGLSDNDLLSPSSNIAEFVTV